MIKLLEDYLNAFREELRGSDRAIVQDALSDAEDHISAAIETRRSQNPGETPGEAARAAIDEYGDPAEIAEHYRKVEKYTAPVLTEAGERDRGFFGVITDPAAWASLLYMLMSLVTGIIYFTWAVTGVSLSAGMIVLIIGVPLTWLFFLSFRGLAFVEGRIVEALLGVRMPRRAVFAGKGDGWWGSMKGVFTTGSTWTSLVYLILMLPLGVTYFSIFTVLTAVSFAMVTDPVFELVLKIQVFDFPEPFWTPIWLMPFVVAGGVLLFLATLHLAGAAGKMHGRLARKMLVSG